MRADDIAYFKDLLHAQLSNLVHQANRTVFSLTDREEIAEADPLDRASSESINEALLLIRSRESRLIGKINDALDRIEEGSFGVCDICGQNIAMARLKARPVASLCIHCKTRMERQERRTA